MKLKYFLLGILAGAAFMTSCEKEGEGGRTILGLDVDNKNVVIPQTGGTVTVKVTTDASWTITSSAAWLTVSPTSGTGSAEITFTAEANEKKDRSTSVKVDGGLTGSAAISVKQAGSIPPGDGLTPETAFTPSEAYAWVMANIATNNASSGKKFYIHGYIHKIHQTTDKETSEKTDDTFTNSSYSNATFFMSDELEYGEGEKDFEAYQVDYLGRRVFDAEKDTDIKVGDEVTIYGPITKYNDTAETMGKGAAYIYQLNEVVEEAPNNYGTPAGEGTKDSPYNVAKAQELAEALDANGKIPDVYVAGTVSAIKEYNAQYHNYTFYIVDEGFEGTFYIYRGKGFNGKDLEQGDIKEGDKVVMYGTLANYLGTSPQMDQNGRLYKINDEVAPEVEEAEPAGEGTAESPYNVAKAIQVAKAQGSTATTAEFYVKGVVAVDAFADPQFKNLTFYIVDKGYDDSMFQVYRLNRDFDGNPLVGFEALKAGDEVVVLGKIKEYSGTPEMDTGGKFVSLNSGTTFPATLWVKNASIEVGAAATEATVSVLSNVAWTAASQTATPDPASGNGIADIKLTFDANTDTENPVVHTLVLSAEGAEPVTVTVTQAKNPGAGVSEVSFVFSEMGYANATDITTVEKEGLTISFDKGDNKNGPKYYTTGSAIRVYGGNSFTVTGGTVQKVEFTFSSGEGTNAILSDSGEFATDTWTGSAESVKFTIDGTSGHRRIASMKVTAKLASGE